MTDIEFLNKPYKDFTLEEKIDYRLFRATEELTCDKCGKHICYMDDFDLEGSYFFCDECKAKVTSS